MALTAKITRNFQVTIPVEVRKQLDIKQGDILAFGVNKGKLVAIPVHMSEEWQKQEEKADEDIKAGKISGPFNDLEEAFRILDGE